MTYPLGTRPYVTYIDPYMAIPIIQYNETIIAFHSKRSNQLIKK